MLSFNQAVEVPGRVLAPGSYVFKLLDGDSQRTMVEIFTADRTQLLTTVMGVRGLSVGHSGQDVYHLQRAVEQRA